LQWKGEKLGVVEMRRHYSNYFKGIPHLKEYKIKLVTEMNSTEIFQVLDSIAVQFEE
jgi:hypothetical protein